MIACEDCEDNKDLARERRPTERLLVGLVVAYQPCMHLFPWLLRMVEIHERG